MRNLNWNTPICLLRGSSRRRERTELIQKVRELDRDQHSRVEAEKPKAEFFANASHELRTLLTLLLAPLESLLAGTYGPVPSVQARVLQTVHNNAARLLQMVTGLLDASSLEAGRLEVRREGVEVAALTRSVLAEFEPMFQHKGLACSFEADPPSAVVAVDRYLYERILFNLLSNAVKFTPEGGRVAVRLRVEDDLLRVSVADTGIGIAHEALGDLFQKFGQPTGSATRRHEGTRLGLALVKQFAEQLGGGVEVKSTPGEGTCFTVTVRAPATASEVSGEEAGLPEVSIVQKYAPARAPAEVTSTGAGRPLVVLAEDNEELAAYLVDLLQDFCDVRYVRDGAEALARVRTEVPDLVLCDIMLPVLDGLCVCRTLKEDPATAAVPFIILTALTDRDALLEGWEAGADEYLFKPFHPAELITRVRSMLSAVAARRKAEQHVRESERQLRELFDHSPDAILVEDRNGNLLDVNKAACRLHAMDRSQLVGRNMRELVPPDRRDEVLQDVRRLLDGEVSYVDSYSWTPAGEAVPVEIRAGRITYAEQEAVLLQVRDVTERRRAEEEVRRLNAELERRVQERTAELQVKNKQLKREVAERKQLEVAARRAQKAAEAANRAKSTFLANMSHEIRTPLTGVIGFASLLAREVSDEHREFAQLIERSGRRLMDTLNSVLTIAKLEAEQVEVHMDMLNVAEEVREIVALSQPLAEEKGLTLAFRVEPEAEGARVQVDRGALSSIFYNLIGNAVKFTDQGGVEVIVGVHEGYVDLHVQDTGVGIDPQFIPHLFDAFRQESAGLSRTHEGSGLGLAITERLVKLMEGHIRVQSEKGKGSRFTVSFPQVTGEERPVEPEVEVPEGVPVAPSRAQLLVVEDNADSAHLMEHALRPLGQVTLATTAEEALRKACRMSFDLVLVDINLGEGPNGADVFKRLRALPAYREVPIVALTAYALPGDRERFLDIGFSTYLSKPFTVEKLLELISSLLPREAVPVEKIDAAGWRDGHPLTADEAAGC